MVCGSAYKDEEDRRRLLETFNMDDAAVAAVVASILVTYGAAPAIAAVVAAIIVKRFMRPAYEEFCVTWKEKLPAADDV